MRKLKVALQLIGVSATYYVVREMTLERTANKLISAAGQHHTPQATKVVRDWIMNSQDNRTLETVLSDFMLDIRRRHN